MKRIISIILVILLLFSGIYSVFKDDVKMAMLFFIAANVEMVWLEIKKIQDKLT